MLSSTSLGALFALTSAAVWGSGDFSGGFASRKLNQFQVLALSAGSGIIVLIPAAVLWKEHIPGLTSLLWAAGAGLFGGIGITCLYYALSLGNTASVAPIAGVVGAILPVLVSMATEGLPGWTRLAGFGVAFLGIGLVSSTSGPATHTQRRGILLAFIAGFGFAGFFVLIAQVKPGEVFAPLVASRLVDLVLALILLRTGGLAIPSPRANPIALLAGVLDAGGNVFFLLARQLTRLDVTAVLASLYPASTMLLAYLVLKEKISVKQWIGAALCILAISLITI